jgi:hypothetical protein
LEVQDRYRGRELVFEAVDGCEIAVKGIFATWPRLLKEELHTPLSLRQLVNARVREESVSGNHVR